METSDELSLQDRTVILLDDVATSGSSITACRSLLYEAGAGKVICAVIGYTDSEVNNYDCY